ERCMRPRECHIRRTVDDARRPLRSPRGVHATGGRQMKMLMLSQADMTALLDLDRLLDALDEGFRALSAGRVAVPARTAVNAEKDGWLATMPGYGSGLGLGVKLVSVFPHNHELGVPSHQALIALFDPATGSPVAVMDGTRITAIRTAGAAAVSVRHLAREDAKVLAIVGAGVQGHAHLEIMPRVRDFEEIRVASRTPDRATEMGEMLLGTRPGRRSRDEVTIYKSMGHAVEDLAAASLVYRAAVAKGAGSTVEL